MQTLADWLRGKGLSPERFGTEALGVSKNTVRRYLRPPGHPEHRRPPDEVKLRIAEATDGEVPVSAWFEAAE